MNSNAQEIGVMIPTISNTLNNDRNITSAVYSVLFTCTGKMKIYDTFEKSTSTFVSEPWQISRKMENKISFTEMDYLRR